MQNKKQQSLLASLILSVLLTVGAILVLSACSPATLANSSTNSVTGSGKPPAGTTLQVFKDHKALVVEAKWSPNGKLIASSSFDDTIKVWDSSTGKVVLTYHITAPLKLSWSHDGNRIAVTTFQAEGKGFVQVFDVHSGKTLVTYKGHSASVTDVAWSPDDTRIASASQDITVQVWNSDTGKTLGTYHGHPAPVYAVAWSPDGKYIASAATSSQTEVHVWDANTRSLLMVYQGHTQQVNSLAFSNDSKRIISASNDKTVKIWNVSTGKVY